MNITAFTSKQLVNGSFGSFHSMSRNSTITTEKFLRRCMFLRIDKTNPFLAKTLTYIKKCINREIEIPDRKEVLIQWHNFEDLMFSTWLLIFDDLNERAVKIINDWANVIEASVIDNHFNFTSYLHNYQKIFGNLKVRQRVINPTNFYVVSLIKNRLSNIASSGFYEHIMNKGVYYIYSNNLKDIPYEFDHKNTIFYLYAILLASSYNPKDPTLVKIKKWILDYQSKDGYWYLNNIKADGIVFPFSTNWRKKDDKLNDIKKYMNCILSFLP